jgi:hypothetical protein
MTYFCPMKFGYKFLSLRRDQFRQRWNGEKMIDGVPVPQSVLWCRFNQMAEFRVVTIRGGDTGSSLFSLPVGDYLASECLQINGYYQTDNGNGNSINQAMMDVEQAWLSMPCDPTDPEEAPYCKVNPNYDAADANSPSHVVQVDPHVVKEFNFDRNQEGNVEPFQGDLNLVTLGTCDQQTLTAFKAYRALCDPDGVFLGPTASCLIGES